MRSGWFYADLLTDQHWCLELDGSRLACVELWDTEWRWGTVAGASGWAPSLADAKCAAEAAAQLEGEVNEDLLFRRAEALWGKEAQLFMLAEECNELAVAVLHRARGRLVDAELVDELADVSIMVEQVSVLLSLSTVVSERRRSKLARLLERVEAAEALHAT